MYSQLIHFFILLLVSNSLCVYALPGYVTVSKKNFPTMDFSHGNVLNEKSNGLSHVFRRSTSGFKEEKNTLINNNDDNFFGNFKSIEEDLEVPAQMPGRMEVYALPPSKKSEERFCPQCITLQPNLFEKLYCSSQLAVRVRFKGLYLMAITQDLTPNHNFANLHQLVSFTMKRQCSCNDLLPGYEAILLVTPPRTFNIRTVQVLHFDDSIALIPWHTANSTILNDHLNCSQILTQNTFSL